MADKSFESLVSRINPSVPGCPYATIVQHIRDAAIDACERTLAWRYRMPMFDLRPGIWEYSYVKPTMAEVHAVLAVLVNQSPLQVLSLEQAVRAYPEIFSGGSERSFETEVSFVYNQTHITFDSLDVFWNSDTITTFTTEKKFDGATPWGVTQISPDRFIVLPTPDDKMPYRIKMVLALKPTRTASDMDEAAFNELEDAIVHGALQRLLVLPKQKWEDRELAAYHAKQYLSRITERRARANLTNARATLRVQIPSF